MNRALIAGDVHCTSHDFTTRLDKSSETVVTKLEFLLNKAEETESDIIFPGDFLDNNRNTKEFLLNLIRLFKKHPNVKCYSIIGNHECHGDDYSSAAYSQLQFLFEAGALKFFDSTVGDIPIPGGRLRGYSAYNQLSTEHADEVLGIVCHHFLIDSFNDTLVVYPDKLKEVFPNLKFIIAGHDHGYYPITTTPAGVTLIRPGSLLRTSSSKENNRVPCYCEVDFTKQPYDFAYKEVPAQKYSEIFSLDVKDMKKEADSAVDNFILEMRRQVRIGVDLSTMFKARLDLVTDLNQKQLITNDLQEHQFLA